MVGEINYGILDPNAPARASESVFSGMRNQMAMQGARQEQQANALALQKQQRALSDEEATRKAYEQSGGDQNKLVESLKSAGQYKQAMEMQTQITAQKAAQRKAQIEQGIQHAETLDKILAGVKDQNTYNMALQQAAQIFGPDEVSKFNPVYNPEGIDLFKRHAIGAKAQAENELKIIDQALAKSKFGFEQSKFAQEQALERAKMGQSERHFQATQGLEREKLGAKTAEGKPLTEAQAKATTFASQMNEASNAMDALEKSGLDLSKKSTQGLVGMAGGVANPLVPADAQQYKQAQNQWSESFLRVKTGAAATKEEVDLNNKTFFPQMGDDAKTIERKRQARTAAERDVLNMAAGGKEKVTTRQVATSAHPPEINDLLKKYGG